MSDENKSQTPPAPEKSKAPAGTRKYIYNDVVHTKDNIKIDCGQGLKIQPWKLSDAEVEKLLTKRPDLTYMWDVN